MEPKLCWRINIPRVAHQIIEGEAVVIDFDTGAYYSVEGVGALIWDWIDQGARLDALVAAVEQRYAGDHAAIATAVSRFVEALQRESLIVPAGGEPVAGPVGPVPQPSADRQAFEEPILLKYNDMQDLLLLDPIHEVDESGWPAQHQMEKQDTSLA